jgi:hypothetical protein
MRCSAARASGIRGSAASSEASGAASDAYAACSSVRCMRSAPSRAGASERASLPDSSPSISARIVAASRPSTATASAGLPPIGSAPVACSSVRAIRCSSTPSCAAAAISAAGAPLAVFICSTCSARPARRGPASSTVRLAAAMPASVGCRPSSMPTAGSTRVQRSASRSTAGRNAVPTGSSRRPPISPPACSSAIASASRARLSASWPNASPLPRTASGAAFASRCECISELPTSLDCSMSVALWRESSHMNRKASSSDTTSTGSSTASWRRSG